MSFVKRGDAEIVKVLDDNNKWQDEEAKRKLEAARQQAKNINKDSDPGNKNGLNKESSQ
jgi:hypothetical protein